MKRSKFGRRLTAIPRELLNPRLPIAYLDTNALSDLSRLRDGAAQIKDVERVRQDLCSFASRRIVAVGQLLFSEMAFMDTGERREDFEADMTFLKQLQFLKIVKPSGDVMRLEVECFLQGLEPIPFIDADVPFPIHEAEWKPVWSEERRTLREAKATFLDWERDADKRIEEWHPDRKDRATRLDADWRRDKRGILVRWVRGRMQKEWKSLGLPADQTRWPHPQSLPTLWCSWAYRITRNMIMQTSPHPRKQQAGDFVDWCHYQTAAHAAEFVTSDARFLEIATAAPGPKPEFMRLDEWIHRLSHEGARA
jgi:hypothetical protein